MSVQGQRNRRQANRVVNASRMFSSRLNIFGVATIWLASAARLLKATRPSRSPARSDVDKICMTWRRGLFGLWLLATLGWVGIYCWQAWQSCLPDLSTADLWCPVGQWSLPISHFGWAEYVFHLRRIFGAPVGALLIGLSTDWVFRELRGRAP
jgi:hypothetical protein